MFDVIFGDRIGLGVNHRIFYPAEVTFALRVCFGLHKCKFFIKAFFDAHHFVWFNDAFGAVNDDDFGIQDDNVNQADDFFRGEELAFLDIKGEQLAIFNVNDRIF